jgi:hypothetical protein
MTLVRGMLRQWAVYWPPIGVDSLGNRRYGEPSEIRALWNRSLSSSIGTMEVTRSSDARVTLGKRVEIGGMLWEGRLLDLEDDQPPSDAMEIEAVGITHRIKGPGAVYDVAVT